MQNKIENLATKHYENFFVGSYFLNKNIRKNVHLIYTFARVADDIADLDFENTQSEKIIKLNEIENELKLGLENKSENDFFCEISKMIYKNNLSAKYFYNLIDAFKSDVYGNNFNNYDDVLNYCKNSANPIGRLMLELVGSNDDENNLYSDKICSAFQIINFIQDFEEDKKNGRNYIPNDLKEMNENNNKILLKYLQFAERLFEEGKPLIQKRIKYLNLELKLFWFSGIEIIRKLKLNLNKKYYLKPKLNIFDKVKIIMKAIIIKV